MSSVHTLTRGSPESVSAQLAAWLNLARVSNSPTVASNVLAGAALAGQVEPSASTAFLVVAMVLFYTAGMLLNDVCDFRWDLVHRPQRPLAQGVVAPSAAFIATLILFGLGTGLLWLVGGRALVSGLILIGLIVLYDVWHKSNPVSPLVMAACRLMVYVTAFAGFAWPPSPMLAFAGGMLVVHLIGLTAIAKSESRPTVMRYWPAALLYVPPLLFMFQVPLLAIAEAAWVTYCVQFVYRRPERRIGVAIAGLIAGISLVDLLVLAATGAPVAMAALAVGAFGLTLLLQRYVEGT